MSEPAPPPRPRTRRPWVRPGIVYREKLEGLAVSCAPVPPAKTNVGYCPRGPISS